MTQEELTNSVQTTQTQSYAVPISIVIAGVFIALAVFFSGGNTAQAPAGQDAYQPQEEVDTTDQIRPVDDTDHYKGPKDAKVTIVEYSDFECPFCSRIHDTMNEIIAEEDDVKWVFRQFPLDQLHPKNARKAAIASECVNKLGGNDAFWRFTDQYFKTSPANEGWDLAQELPALISFAGVDKAAFDACYTSGEFDQHVQDDVENAVATGGRGTPWSVLITASGATMPINGAQPKEVIKQMIEYAREN